MNDRFPSGDRTYYVSDERLSKNWSGWKNWRGFCGWQRLATRNRMRLKSKA